MRTTIVRGYIFGLISIVLLFISSVKLFAQIETDQVSWSANIVKTSDTTAEIRLSADIDANWHIYGLSIPDGGPSATTLHIDNLQGATIDGNLSSKPKEEVHFDNTFNMNIGVFYNEVTLIQKIKVSDFNNLSAEGYVRYMACTEENCTPPQSWDFSVQYTPSVKETKTKEVISAKTNIANNTIVEVKDEIKPSNPKSTDIAIKSDTVNNITNNKDRVLKQDTMVSNLNNTSFLEDLWAPVTSELKAFGDKNADTANSSLWVLFIAGFLGGLLALLTPCVWPMIPMTVSFFLKRNKNRKKGIRDAITYGIGIIVIYLALGLIITALFGSNALNNLATHAIFNIIFFLLLVLFAISFFGAFDIVLPAKWTNRMDSKADSTTGLLSIFFMSFTLALVSFSCTGPIIGTLLVQAASMGTYLGPAIGMFGFALALALPFSLFAIFPSWLQSMPKSGGWLNSVKVVLGFLELALSLKFLSVADLAYGWHILDRETFIALWIIIFALLGFYLLGKIRFSHDSPKGHTSVLGLFLAIISLSFSVYMVPGLWGAPLRSISGFAPPLTTQDFNLYSGEVHAKFDDYDAGMDYAKKVGKPVLLDFSGYGCVNCRKMEASIWTNPIVKNILEDKYVLITLMVDDKKDLPEPIIVQENGKKVKLRTIGDKWSYLQRVKFGANVQPYYVAVDNNGKPLEATRSYNENVKEYINFLEKGIANYKALHK